MKPRCPHQIILKSGMVLCEELMEDLPSGLDCVQCDFPCNGAPLKYRILHAVKKIFRRMKDFS